MSGKIGICTAAYIKTLAMKIPSPALLIPASIKLIEILIGSVKNDFHRKYLTSIA
jgi:hypothetical protein